MLPSLFQKTDWELSVDALILGLLSILIMKGIALWRLPPGQRKISLLFFFTPLYSPLTWEEKKPATRKIFQDLLSRGAKFAPMTALSLAFYYFLIEKYEIPLLFKSYLALFPLYYLTELVGLLIQLFFLPFGWRIPPTHQGPLSSKSLSQFWGGAWNPWVQTWLKQVLFTPLEAKPFWGILAVFLFSGLWHEFLINYPFYYVRRTSLFGTMILYFLIQGMGVVWDKFYLEKRYPRIRRIFLWCFVLGPAPLFMNEATLRIFHLYRF